MRVVSLLPSATELLCAAGAADLLVGRSHECDWPAEVTDRPVLTAARTTATTSAAIDAQVRAAVRPDPGAGADTEARAGAAASPAASLYTLDADLLARLEPDVILTQDLCDVCSIDLETVRGAASRLPRAAEIISLNPMRLEDILDDLLRIGEAVGREAPAHRAMVALRDRFWSAIDHVNAFVDGPVVGFLGWMDPLFAPGHWTPQLIERAGTGAPVGETGRPSRRIEPEELVAAQPERLVICPCGMDLAAIRRELPALAAARWWSALPAVADGQVMLVDGNAMFSRPGPRLVDAFEWLVAWLHDRPELGPAGFPAETL